jgi:hypothetical protein
MNKKILLLVMNLMLLMKSIVDSIHEKNVEITNKQTWENKNMTVSNTDTC